MDDLRRSSRTVPREGEPASQVVPDSQPKFFELADEDWQAIEKVDRQARVQLSIERFERRYIDIIKDWFNWYEEVENGSNRTLSEFEKDQSAKGLIRALAIRKECAKRGYTEEMFYSEEDYSDSYSECSNDEEGMSE